MKRQEANLAAVAFHNRTLGYGTPAVGIIRPLAVDVGAEFREDRGGLGFVEDGDEIDRFQSGHGLGTVFFANQGTQFALYGADARIAVQADYQDVAEGSRLRETANVADVQKVKAAVGPDDLSALLSPRFTQGQKFVEGEDFLSDTGNP